MSSMTHNTAASLGGDLGSGPTKYMIPWAYLSPHPKWHLGQLYIFAGLTVVTNRHIHTAAIGRQSIAYDIDFSNIT